MAYDEKPTNVNEFKFNNPVTTLDGSARATINLSIKIIGSSAWDCVISVMPAQPASVVWSDRIGFNVDDPFLGQSTLTRVVSCVQHHPLEPVE